MRVASFPFPPSVRMQHLEPWQPSCDSEEKVKRIAEIPALQQSPAARLHGFLMLNFLLLLIICWIDHFFLKFLFFFFK